LFVGCLSELIVRRLFVELQSGRHDRPANAVRGQRPRHEAAFERMFHERLKQLRRRSAGFRRRVTA
jgi:hypothetical protein